jgi:hypothetical protein
MRSAAKFYEQYSAMKNIALACTISFLYILHTPGGPESRRALQPSDGKKKEHLFYKNEKEAESSVATAPKIYALLLS